VDAPARLTRHQDLGLICVHLKAIAATVKHLSMASMLGYIPNNGYMAEDYYGLFPQLTSITNKKCLKAQCKVKKCQALQRILKESQGFRL
jgi:hypothetical protein